MHGKNSCFIRKGEYWVIKIVNDNLDKAKFITQPFNHWIYDKVLPENIANDLSELNITHSSITNHNGKRDSYNSTRVFFNKKNCLKNSLFENVADIFKNQKIILKLSHLCGKNLSNGKLRIEYTLDTGDFWLEPHLDIKEKLLTFLIYLSNEKESKEWGTTIYNPDLSFYKKIPYKLNLGFMFMAGKNTWHGVPKQKIKGIRKSLIINYVTNNWRSLDELVPL